MTQPALDRIFAVRAVTAALGGVVLLAGTASVIGFFMVRTDVDTSVFRQPVTKVKVTSDTGDVHIEAGTAGPGATVVSHGVSAFRTAEHHERVRDGVLEVKAVCRGGLMVVADSCSIDFDITVPPGTAVNVTSTTGDVGVFGTEGPVNVRSGTGDVRVHGTDGTVLLAVNTGDIRADGVKGGQVTTRTHTGDTRLGFSVSPDAVTATSDTGDLRLQVPRDGTLYRVLTDSSVNEAHIDLPVSTASNHRIALSTNTGRIEAEARLSD